MPGTEFRGPSFAYSKCRRDRRLSRDAAGRRGGAPPLERARRGALAVGSSTYDGKSFQESIIAIYRFELCFGVVTVCSHVPRTNALGRTDNFLTQMRGKLFGGLSIQNDPDS